MSGSGKVKVLVNSKRIPVRTLRTTRPIFSYSGVPLGNQESVGVLYGSSISDSDLRAIDEAKKLSCNLGLDLEIIEMSTVNPLRRLISAITGTNSGPSVVLIPSPSEGFDPSHSMTK